MATRHIILPSGLAGQLRGFKTKDANLLADKAGMKQGIIFERILDSCWEKTDDPGPYDVAGKKLDWLDVLVADRMAALVAVRAATYPEPYSFPVQCEVERCREPFHWDIDLDKQLTVKPLPPASIERFKNGNRFPITIPGTGHKAHFQLQTGRSEAAGVKLVKARGATQLISCALYLRVPEVEGVDNRLAFFDDLDLGDANALIQAMDEADGGVETDIEIECPSCATRQQIQLPFGREFFLPSRKKIAG